MNAANSGLKHVNANEELQHLKTILGLSYGKDYRDPKDRAELRYGKVMLMTDQDHDGIVLKTSCLYYYT